MTSVQPATTPQELEQDAQKMAVLLVEAVKESEAFHASEKTPGLLVSARKTPATDNAIDAYEFYQTKYPSSEGGIIGLSDEFLRKIRDTLNSLNDNISLERWKKLDDEIHQDNNSPFHALFDAVFSPLPRGVTLLSSKTLHKDAENVADLLGEAITSAIEVGVDNWRVYTHQYIQLKSGYSAFFEKYHSADPSVLDADAQKILEAAVLHLFQENPKLFTEGIEKMSAASLAFFSSLNPALVGQPGNWVERTGAGAAGHKGQARE